MITLHKILPLLFSPIFITLALVTIGAIKEIKALIFLGLALLYLSSTQWVGNLATTVIEHGVPRANASDVVHADAIVVLSGILRATKINNTIDINWGDPDRLFAGVLLYKLQKSNRLIFTGGKSPWESKLLPEGSALKNMAIELGVSSTDILISDDAYNTEQEAMQVRKLLPINNSNIILVTSAFHIPRAVKIFENAGFVVTPFAVDFHGGMSAIEPLQLLPRPDALSLTDSALREALGRVYYYLMHKFERPNMALGGLTPKHRLAMAA